MLQLQVLPNGARVVVLEPSAMLAALVGALSNARSSTAQWSSIVANGGAPGGNPLQHGAGGNASSLKNQHLMGSMGAISTDQGSALEDDEMSQLRAFAGELLPLELLQEMGQDEVLGGGPPSSGRTAAAMTAIGGASRTNIPPGFLAMSGNATGSMSSNEPNAMGGAMGMIGGPGTGLGGLGMGPGQGWQPTNYSIPGSGLGGMDASPFNGAGGGDGPAGGAGMGGGNSFMQGGSNAPGANRQGTGVPSPESRGASSGSMPLGASGSGSASPLPLLPQDIIRAIEKRWPNSNVRTSSESLCQVSTPCHSVVYGEA